MGWNLVKSAVSRSEFELNFQEGIPIGSHSSEGYCLGFPVIGCRTNNIASIRNKACISVYLDGVGSDVSIELLWGNVFFESIRV